MKGLKWFWYAYAAVGTICTIAGIIFCIVYLGNLELEETTGVISEIYRYRDSDGDRHGTVYVKYEVDGEEYESKLGSYSSSYREGKEIDIAYDVNNPEKIRAKGTQYLAFLFPGLGIIFGIIGWSGVLVMQSRKNKEKDLFENGRCVYANYVETRTAVNVAANGRHPYVIVCSWDNPSDGKKYMFKSKYIWEQPEPIIQDQNIKTFPVYIDENNIKRYAMDVSIIQENIVDLT